MGIGLLPEIKMARKIIQKHSLTVPFNLDNLINKYAIIIYKAIQVDGVDGICLNLKTAGKTPTVIINTNSPETRQRFTLAHELGHIIIPWHLGTIIDDIDENAVHPNTEYWKLEREANRFASELLIPFEWIYSLYKKNSDPKFLLYQIREQCGVSETAASIRLQAAISEINGLLIPVDWILQLYGEYDNPAQAQKVIVEETNLHPKRVADHIIQHLPGKIAFCIESGNIVKGCGSTIDAHSYYQVEGKEFIKNPYPYYQNYFFYELNNLNFHWWVLDTNFQIPDDSRSWREILEKIANEISPSQGVQKFKITVNAKLSGVNGNWRRKKPGLGLEDFIKDAIQRFNNTDYEKFLNHPDFLIFIRKRSEAFFTDNLG